MARRAPPGARGPRAFARHRGGGVLVVVALGACVLMGAAAVGLDLGLVVQARRRAQAAADIAALVAAADTALSADRALRLAGLSLADNGYGGATPLVSVGSYDAGAASGARFVRDASPVDAVRVEVPTQVAVGFGRAIGLPPSVPIRVVGTAASARFAAFTISGAVRLDGGIANAVLGALLGARLSLAAADYDALLDARVDGLRVLDALGVSLGLQAASYTQIAQASASVGQMLMAMRAAAQGSGQGSGAAVAALAGLLNALPNAGPLVQVGQVDGLGDAATLAPGRGLAGPSLRLMDLVGATAAVANGGNQVSADLGAAVPGLLSARLTLAVGERRRSSGWVRPGGAVSTAQVRLLIEAGLSAPLGLGTLTLPLYAELAPARATLRALACPQDGAARQVTIDAQTGLATFAVAAVARSAIGSGATSPDLSQPATLVAGPLPVLGRGGASVGAGAQTLVFTDADIAAHTVRTASPGAVVGSLTGGLLGGLSLSVGGVGVGLPLQGALAATLAAAATPLDLILDGTLRTLGLRVGYADVSVDGALCGQAVLVQ